MSRLFRKVSAGPIIVGNRPTKFLTTVLSGACRSNKMSFGGTMIGLMATATKAYSTWQMSDWILKPTLRSLAFLERKLLRPSNMPCHRLSPLHFINLIGIRIQLR